MEKDVAMEGANILMQSLGGITSRPSVLLRLQPQLPIARTAKWRGTNTAPWVQNLYLHDFFPQTNIVIPLTGIFVSNPFLLNLSKAFNFIFIGKKSIFSHSQLINLQNLLNCVKTIERKPGASRFENKLI